MPNKRISGWISFNEHEVFRNRSGERYWGDAGAGMLPVAADTRKILVGFRSEYVNEPHTWGIFGGSIDPHEKPREAAERELREETGYDGTITNTVQAYTYNSPTGGFVFYNFVCVVDGEFVPHNSMEVEYFRWVTLAELEVLSPKHFGLADLLDNGMDTIKKYAI